MKRIMVILMLMTMILVVAACDLNGTTTTTPSTSSTTTTSTRSITTTSTPSTTSSRKTWWTLPKTTTTTTLLTTTMPSFPDTIEGQMAERLYLINREWEFFSVRYVRIEGTIRVYDEQDEVNQSMEYVLSIRLNYTQHRLIATLIGGELVLGGFAVEPINDQLALRTRSGYDVFTELAPTQVFSQLLAEEWGLFSIPEVMTGTPFTKSVDHFFTKMTSEAFLENRLYLTFLDLIHYVPDDFGEILEVYYILPDHGTWMTEVVQIPLHPVEIPQGFRAEMELVTYYFARTEELPTFPWDAFYFEPRDKELAVPLDLTSRPVNNVRDVLIELGIIPNYVAYRLDPGTYRFFNADTEQALEPNAFILGPGDEVLSLDPLVVETSGIYYLVLHGGGYDPIPVALVEVTSGD